MANYRIGKTIRDLREKLNITQEDLCDGICSVPTLSRIENGTRLPNKANFDALMQRMGRDGNMYDALMDDHDFAVHEKKFEMRQCLLLRDYDRLRLLLDEFASLTRADAENLHRQFFLYIEAILEAEKDGEKLRALEKLQEAIKITVPKYGTCKIGKLYLTYDEIVILNNIGVTYSEMGRMDEAVELLQELEKYIDAHNMDAQGKTRMYPLILHNLTKCLGISERYLECIQLCEKGIEFCIQIDCTRLMAKFHYNRAWAMVKRGKPEQQEEAKNSVLLAYILSMSVKNEEQMLHYAKFAREHFNIELSELPFSV
ncbi:MAG: helix-turn-helix domain-containing protein [Clostridiaceae bacterium]|nr:helix-turn-helix transcriptional regulator [Eubacteriales bacterium]